MIGHYTYANTVMNGVRVDIEINGGPVKDMIEAWRIGFLVWGWTFMRDTAGKLVMSHGQENIARKFVFGIGRVKVTPL